MDEVDMKYNVEEVSDLARAPSATSFSARRRSSVTKPPKKWSKAQRKAHNATRLGAAVDSGAIAAPSTAFPIPQSMSLARPVPLLICSVGNPGATYANTLHSAGHTVLNKLAAHLGYSQFSKEKACGNGLLSRPPISGGAGDWTLWQSTSYMNESGKGTRAAFLAWSKTIPADVQGKLVVVHDELEKPLGAVSVKEQGSPKGHNGLKSIIAHMNNVPFVRIGVGIGRPVSRASDDVARFVLKKMTPDERAVIDGSIEEIVKRLRKIETG